ncbi:MAG: tRNA pseudouridine(13) synthase TruD [Betaproteobacteria bacterium]
MVSVERSGLPLTTAIKIVTAENLNLINSQVKEGKLRVALPIVGFKQKLSQGVMGQVEKEVLTREGVEIDNLWLNELSRVGGKGGLRTLVTPVLDFKLQKIGDEKVMLSFMLHRGCYATVFLREIMKPQNPVAAGF